MNIQNYWFSFECKTNSRNSLFSIKFPTEYLSTFLLNNYNCHNCLPALVALIFISMGVILDSKICIQVPDFQRNGKGCLVRTTACLHLDKNMVEDSKPFGH